MCGIAGHFPQTGPLASETLAPVLKRLKHRGPDNTGTWQNDNLALGHTRLSILDLSVRANQPMVDRNNGNVIVLNGEIYNFLSLKNELEAKGHSFQTDSDTEVVLALYGYYGVDCLGYLRGMFALAIWDEKKQHLFIARDRFGKKPLYYCQNAAGFTFASEIRALVSHSAVGRDIDFEAIDLYLSLEYIPAPWSIYQSVRKLPPATYGIVRNGSLVELVPYWTLTYTQKATEDTKTLLDRVHHELIESVRLRLISDVPLGALLSGGLDSSLIVAMMSRLSRNTVKTFSIGFAANKFNELPFAQKVARHLGTEHHEEIMPAGSLEQLFGVIDHYGEPYADDSALASFLLSRMARTSITVALNGDGGDELACGYSTFRHAKIASFVHQILHNSWKIRRSHIHTLFQASSPFRRFQRTLYYRYIFPESKPILRDERALLGIKERLYRPDFSATLEENIFSWKFDWLARSFDFALNPIERMLWIHNQTALPHGLLTKMDIAAMASSLEVRSPFLDHKLAELCATLPVSLKIRHNQGKYFLKRIALDYLPQEIINRRKQGFAMPLNQWLKEPMSGFMLEIFQDARSGLAEFFETDYIFRLANEHISGLHNHWVILWRLLNFAIWLINEREARGSV